MICWFAIENLSHASWLFEDAEPLLSAVREGRCGASMPIFIFSTDTRIVDGALLHQAFVQQAEVLAKRLAAAPPPVTRVFKDLPPL